MLEIATIPLSAAGATRLRTARAPRGARLVAGGLDALGQNLEEERFQAALAHERRAAHEEATRTAARALEAAAEALDAAREQAVAALSGDAVSLAVEIARQILKVEITASNYDLEQMVRSTLAASGVKRGRCVVHVNAEDAEMLEGVVFREEPILQPDADVARGAVHVETPRGLLVREPAAALEEIREQLLEDLA